MQQSDGAFDTADGLSIYTVSWLPDGDPQAVVVLVHGIAEHIGRYRHVAETLVNAGYAVYGLDHRGHGKSTGLRAHFDNIDQPVNDLHHFFEQIQGQHPNSKIFLLGHSMGSLIGLEFTLRYQTELSGLILTGTATNVDENVAPVLQSLGSILRHIVPKVPFTPPLPSSTLCSDPVVGDAYDNDPLVYRGNTRIGLGTLILTTGKALRSQASELTLPLLIMHGEADEITPISGSRTINERAASQDKTLHTYPGMCHEIMNEVDKAAVLQTIVAWLDEH